MEIGCVVCGKNT